jgi:predicted NAD/FAD-binding protein
MRIAIVGSGIAGMSAAYYLRQTHEVTVFEAGSYIGGHTNTIDVQHQGRDYAIDTGFIVFNNRTYPNFIALLDELDVAFQPTSMSFSVTCESSGLEYRGADFNGLFAQRRNLINPRFWKLLAEMMRFNRSAERLLGPLSPDITVGEFFKAHRFGQSFREHFFLPMASAIWSCPNSTVEQFPMRFIVEFYRHHGLLSVTDRPQWYVIKGGSQQYMRKLATASKAKILINSPVTSVTRSEGSVSLTFEQASESIQTQAFDHVIFACHSDQALRILGASATSIEREILAAFPYERNEAVLHTDETQLPKSRRAWACWNYYLPNSASPLTNKATVTYNMNLLQGVEADTTFCVSLNCSERIDPARVIRAIEYHHPIFTVQRREMQQRHSELLGHNRTSFVGAYWGNGFHEDGVVSALAACKQINETSKAGPWKVASMKAGFDTDDTRRSKTVFVSESA